MDKHIFYLKRNGVTIASGYYQDGKFIVFKGSTYNYRSTLNAWAGMEMKNEMAEDMEFSSPSTAGVYCLGQKSCNGWTEWKDANGITLDAIYRKKSEE